MINPPLASRIFFPECAQAHGTQRDRGKKVNYELGINKAEY